MFQIRDIIPTDLAEVYTFTRILYQYHSNVTSEGLLGDSEFIEIFTQGYLHGLLLTTSETDPSQNNQQKTVRKSRMIGFMIYHPTVSTVRGQGIYLGQFFLLPEFRRRGLGKRMMSRLCQIGLSNRKTHIKLICQEGLEAEKVYEKLGFVNNTKLSPGLRLFQAFGRSDWCKMLDEGKKFEKNFNENGQFDPFMQLVIHSEALNKSDWPRWTALKVASLSNQNNRGKHVTPPTPQLVLITDRKLGESEQSTSTVDVTDGHMMCTFTEQLQVCSWTGPLILFSDFMGNTSALRPELLYNRVREWLKIEPNLRGAYWEVPCGTECREEPSTTLLTRFLNQLNVIDGSEQEGWNIWYLGESGMRHLAGLFSTD
ncbi:unnamed protein product [Fasciola hepatica]|uniref:N-acetyltransferase domain-containing protein n=1 Tax=Fasciola hepatica TaxID=6192 RepID=A0ABC9HFP3_FASHE|nr:unnamed protein product [Fasciola hepatica]